MGVELVVLAIANRLVTRHRHRVARKLLKIHLRPVEVVLHRRVRLLVERHAHMEVWALQDDIFPGRWFAPPLFESPVLEVCRLVPPLRKLWLKTTHSSRGRKLLKDS